MENSIINEIIEATEYAYSVERYTKQGWINTIEYLYGKCFTVEQIINFMLSKDMRWAADSYSVVTEYGQFTELAVKEYLENLNIVRNKGLRFYRNTFNS